VDPNESERLAKQYAAMSDGELEKVAADLDQLTPEAQQALRTELSKRNLEAPPAEAQSDPIVEGTDGRSEEPEPTQLDPNRWVMLRRFRDLPEAMLAKGSLDSAGIECHLADENMVRLDWFISNLIGNAKLIVKPEDVQDAEAVLSQPIPEEFEYGEGEEFEQPKCPQCQSVDITFETLNKPIAYGSAWLGFPLPLKSEKWICNNCGARWVEEPDPAESTEESR
jgi:Putative prokaryotic signal transducing protein